MQSNDGFSKIVFRLTFANDIWCSFICESSIQAVTFGVQVEVSIEWS